MRVSIVGWMVRSTLGVGELALLVPLLYLAVLSVAALAGGRRARWSQHSSHAGRLARWPSFAVLIPAHNEEVVIAGAVRSVASVAYPEALRHIVVVADNCTDGTATVARDAGAIVYERFDDTQRAKGFALRWLLDRLADEGKRFDAYVIVDADSQLSPTFLELMAGVLATGAKAAQGQYRVANDDGAWTAGLRAVAFALFNHLRPLGRSVFGWSAGLKGNGMCFSRDVIERLGWGSHSLAEDAEYHALLVTHGIRVVYVPEAVVTSEMPTSLRQARSQQARWERGRLDLVRACAGPLLRSFLQNHDLAALDAVLEIAVPPLSMLMAAGVACLGCAILLRWEPALLLAVALLALLALHVCIGAALAELSGRAYLSLLRAPLYIAWKCWVYLAAFVGRGGGPWVRTERAVSK